MRESPLQRTSEAEIPLLTAREIFDLVRDDLVRVEQEISTQNAEAIPAVAEVGSYVIQGGGKRLRPALLLISAGMCGYRGNSTIRLGAVMEMIHTATLIHDDVIDETNLRRGRPSANSRWGNHRSVLAGDWLYMQSFQLALRERNFRILDVLIELTQNMVEGELLQLDLIGRMDVTDRQAMELSYRKTACLFSGCAQLGAVLASQDPETEQAMADYGRFVGLAFQLVDDLLDFTSDPQKIGKPVLNDLKEGKVTLPLIYAMAEAQQRERDLVAAVLSERSLPAERAEQILDLVRRSGAIERSRSLAQDYAAQAKASMPALPDSDFRRALMAVPDFLLDREN
ncbi:MAG TPA: polyprenyl synthetase family protein [Candidatus Acidoferrales bacterium]|nr:polyprenyl synthetase family protein [Candidatus Acidoferrales bacterium]